MSNLTIWFTGLIGGARNYSFAISVKLIKDRISSKSITAIKESGLEDYINTVIYWNRLGLAYRKSDKYEEAIKSYKHAIRIDPDYASAHYALGVAYGRLGKYEEAIKSYKHAIRIDPDYAMAHYKLGVCYIDNRDKSSALKQHNILKKLDTKRAKKLLGMIYTELD